MNLLAKIYIIFQISRRHSFMNYLIPAPKVRSYYSLFCRKEGKKLLSCPKLAPFFAGGGLSRQWKKSRLFCNMWSYEVIFVRNFLPSSLNYFFVKRLSGKKMCIAEAAVVVQSMAVILINDTTVKLRPFGFHPAHQHSTAWLLPKI